MTPDSPVALITGTKRIGRAVGLALAERGYDVALAFRSSADEAESAATRIRSLGRRAIALQADLASAEACRSLVTRTVDAFDRLDVAVLLASQFVRTPFDDLDTAAWDAALAVDLSASFHCAHAAIPYLRRTRGRIVLFADWVAASGRPRYKGYLPYYVAKRSVIALGEALALEVASDGVLVNTIAPGPIVPVAGSTAAEQDAVLAATPLGHWGGDDEVARRVVDLFDTAFVTGETLRVDGGRHLN